MGTFTIMGAGADSVMWSLGGDDAEDFSINGGVLAFDVRPGLREPDGCEPMSESNTNTYMVTVMAEAGGEVETSAAITVTVADVDELGTLMSPTIPCHIRWRTARLTWEPSPSWAQVPETRSCGAWEATDAEDFSINGGVLAFMSDPGLREPTGRDAMSESNTNTYDGHRHGRGRR